MSRQAVGRQADGEEQELLRALLRCPAHAQARPSRHPQGEGGRRVHQRAKWLDPVHQRREGPGGGAPPLPQEERHRTALRRPEERQRQPQATGALGCGHAGAPLRQLPRPGGGHPPQGDGQGHPGQGAQPLELEGDPYQGEHLLEDPLQGQVQGRVQLPYQGAADDLRSAVPGVKYHYKDKVVNEDETVDVDEDEAT